MYQITPFLKIYRGESQTTLSRIDIIDSTNTIIVSVTTTDKDQAVLLTRLITTGPTLLEQLKRARGLLNDNNVPRSHDEIDELDCAIADVDPNETSRFHKEFDDKN